MTQDTVFPTDALRRLANQHSETLRQLASIEADLNRRFVDMQDPILALILAVASGEPLLLVGPPGTAKSRLIRAFCEYVGIDPNTSGRQDGGYFEYLLTPFTEPSELFGYYNIGKAVKENALDRDDDGMLQNATIVYLDEVFNGSSAILNSILAVMNERVFHDRGRRTPVKMQAMFGATNNTPRTPELRAIYDRFLLRSPVLNMPARGDKLGQLFMVGWSETYSQNGQRRIYETLLRDLAALRADIAQATASDQLTPKAQSGFYHRLAARVQKCRQYDYSYMSNRRVIKMLNVMMIHALYNAVRRNETGIIALGEDEQKLLRFAVDRWDDDLTAIVEL